MTQTQIPTDTISYTMAPQLAANKKAFKKVGQKKPTPAKEDGLRKFYSSLLKQNPNSMMALKWLVDHGCLTPKKTDAAVLILGIDKLKI